MKKKIIIGIIFIVLLTASISAGILYTRSSAGPRDDSLVGYWTFDNEDINGTVLYDKSGNGWHGTINGNPTIISGVIGNALDMDGTGDYVRVPAIDLSGTQITISYWFKGSNAQRAVNGQTGATSPQWQFPYTIGGIRRHRSSPIVYTTAVYVYADNNSGATLEDGSWHHVAVTWKRNTTNGFKSYLDGVLVDQANSQDGDWPDLSGIWMGSYLGFGEFTTGALDEVRIYKRTLSSKEIVQLYQSSKTNYIRELARATSTAERGEGLVAYWSFDEQDVKFPTVYDKSGNGNNGTIVANGAISAGKIGTALESTGISDNVDYLSVPHPPDGGAFDLSFTDFTMSAWIYPQGDTCYYIVREQGSGGEDILWQMNNNLNLTLDDGPNRSGGNLDNGGNSIPVSQWNHVVVLADRGNVAKGYVNGKALPLTPSIATVTGDISTDGTFNISPGSFAACWNLDGKIDEFRVYNYLLSEEEILALYNAPNTKAKYKQGLPREGLVGYWNMDQNDISGTRVFDKSGNMYHGVPTGFYNNLTPTSTAGKINQAIDFDGSNGYLSVGNIGVTDNWTIAFWAKQDSVPVASAYPIGTGGGGADTDGIFINGPDVSNKYGISDGVSTVSSTSTVQLHEWHHVSAVKSGTSYSLYIDGLLENVNALADMDLSNIEVGRRSDGTLYFNGQIDEVVIYNRALSAQEVAQLYNYKIEYVR